MSCVGYGKSTSSFSKVSFSYWTPLRHNFGLIEAVKITFSFLNDNLNYSISNVSISAVSFIVSSFFVSSLLQQ